jgi:protein-disulfide isomerase
MPQPTPRGPSSRRQRRQQARAEQAVRPTGKPTARRSHKLPPKRPAWQSPTAIVTALALIATVVLIVVLNLHPSSSPAVALVTPANPVGASVARDGSSLGPAGAPIKVDAWEDYQCPYCQIWSEQFEPHLVTDFVAAGTVRYQFHDFSFIGQGHDPDESLAAAVAAQCAGDQNRFWEYHDWLYANQNPAGENKGWFTRAKLDSIALKVGLDQTGFDTCLADPARATAVAAEQAAGAALGINSTPSVFLNAKPVTLNTYADLAAQIRALAPAASGSPAAPASPAASASP